MGGENIAGQNFFSPTSTVNRGDFLTMAMKAADRAPASATGSFDEDRAVLTNVYATEAVAAGLITGDAEGNLALNTPITRSEAAVILSKLLPETSDVAT